MSSAVETDSHPSPAADAGDGFRFFPNSAAKHLANSVTARTFIDPQLSCLSPSLVNLSLRNPRLHQLAFALLCACLLFYAEAQSAETSASIWPQWRGPGRDGQFHGSTWPDQLDTNSLRQLWRVELGPSYSGPIVAGDRVFTTETKDKRFEGVTALDRATGKQLWRVHWEGAMTVPFFAKANGDWIRATPALDGDRLYVAE